MTIIVPGDHTPAAYLPPLQPPLATGLWAWLRAWAFQIVFCTGLVVWAAGGVLGAAWLLHAIIGTLVGL